MSCSDDIPAHLKGVYLPQEILTLLAFLDDHFCVGFEMQKKKKKISIAKSFATMEKNRGDKRKRLCMRLRWQKMSSGKVSWNGRNAGTSASQAEYFERY